MSGKSMVLLGLAAVALVMYMRARKAGYWAVPGSQQEAILRGQDAEFADADPINTAIRGGSITDYQFALAGGEMIPTKPMRISV